MKRMVLISALALLIVGCSKINPADRYYVLSLSTVVVDENKEPIQGICAYPEGDTFHGRLGYSDHLGRISAFSHIEPRRRWIVYFEDVDGEYNRGVYERLEVDITEMAAAPIAPDKWGYSGSGHVDLDTVIMRRLQPSKTHIL